MKKILTILFLFIAVSFLSNIPVKGQEKAVKIVVLGSSTAVGVGPSNSYNAWVNRYRRYVQSVNPQNEVYNLAVGGYKTYHLMPTGYVPPAGQPAPDVSKNITKALTSFSPNAIIINLPSNDASAGIPVADQLKNYDSILAHADEAKVPVWISTTQPRNLNQNGLKDLIDMKDSTFAHFGDKAIDFWTSLARNDGTINPAYDSGDHIHLNDDAHGILFERVVNAEILKFLSDSCQQAEDYWTATNIEISTNYSGNSGSGFIHFKENTNSSASYKLKAVSNTTVTLTFRYSNKGTLKTGQLLINGVVQPDELNFASTGLKTIWNRFNRTINLLEGDNLVEVRCFDDEGSIYLDFISWDDPQVTYIKRSIDSSSCIINIDCGHDEFPSEGNWNNFNLAQMANPESIVELVDSKGNYTGISSYVYDSFGGANRSGSETPDESLNMLGSATKDSYFGNTEPFQDEVCPTGGFKFTGLEAGTAYSFQIFASRMNVTDNREAKYTAVGQNTGSATLNPSDNTSNFANIWDIMPDANGVITLNSEPGPNNDNRTGFFYIGVIRIAYEVTTSNNALELDGEKINVYPVPFNDKLTLANVPLRSTISVYTIRGVKVLEVQSNENGLMELNTSAFRTGIYLLNVSNGDSLMKIFKVVKK